MRVRLRRGSTAILGWPLGIKSRSYMADRARMVANVPGDLALFSAEDCNIEGSVFYETLVSVADWNKLETEAKRDGPCVVGIDLGSTDSLSAAAVIWPATGRLEVYAACAAVPELTLLDRGRGDGVGARYKQLSDAGELWVYEGQRTTPVGLFIADLAGRAGRREGGSVRLRPVSESRSCWTHSRRQSCRWSPEWRGKGVVDGSADIRAFQRAVKQRWLRPCRGRLLLTHAISEAVLKRDPIGNATLHKVRFRGRIDAASATVIAASLAERIRNRPAQPVSLIRGRGAGSVSARHSAMPRRVWLALRIRMFERDGWKCRRCARGGRLGVRPHYPPRQRRRRTRPGNLQTLCRHCHMLKSAHERQPISNHPAAVAGRTEWAAEVARAFG